MAIFSNELVGTWNSGSMGRLGSQRLHVWQCFRRITRCAINERQLTHKSNGFWLNITYVGGLVSCHSEYLSD